MANPSIGEGEQSYVQDCLESHWISSSGKYIEVFETAFAARFNASHAVCVSNGTIAIELALKALGVSPGDEVIVPNLTFVGSVSPIVRLNAIPVLVPCRKDSWNLDPNALETLITRKTKAIVAVHLYGMPCDIGAVVEIANRHGLKVVEDCAEALGAKVGEDYVGTFGDITCFSFFGNKVLTTGEGGLCMTNDPELADLVRLFRDHGMCKQDRFWHRVIGYNGRMTNLQAAVGLGQLERLDQMISRRNEIHKGYRSILDQSELFMRIEAPANVYPVTWIESPVLAPGMSLDRDRLLADLRRERIETRSFFFPVSVLPAYSRFGAADEASEFFSSHGFNLPTYETLDDEAVRFIAEKTVDYLKAQAERGPGITLPLRCPKSRKTCDRYHVSIILPTFNEAGNVARIVAKLRSEMVSMSKNYEILIMDDRSTDRTVKEIRERFKYDYDVVVTVRQKPRSLANSIYDGVKMARGDFVVIMDADFNHDPEIVGSMVKFAEFYDVVSGSRFIAGGGMQSRIRQWCSFIFNLWIRLLLLLPTRDNTAGFFCIRRSRLLELDLDRIFYGYGDYFFRLLYAAHCRGFTISEIPVWYRDREYGYSKTSYSKTLCRYIWQALMVRMRSLVGKF